MKLNGNKYGLWLIPFKMLLVLLLTVFFWGNAFLFRKQGGEVAFPGESEVLCNLGATVFFILQ